MAPTNKKHSFARVMLLIAAALPFTCSNETNEINYNCETASIPENSIAIKFENEGNPAIYNPYENDVSIRQDGNKVIVQLFRNDHNLVVSGTTENGSLKIYGNHRAGLYLNGANITNKKGPAINIQNRNTTSVHLVSKTENYLADGEERYEITSGEDAKGAFFSEGQILFSGCGALKIAAKRAHAIAVDNAIEIEGGKITAITTSTKSHGISAHSAIIGGNANIKLEAHGNGAKGIKSDEFIAIKGGTTNIRTYGNMHIDKSTIIPDTNSATGIKTDGDMEMSGGNLAVKTFGTKTKGINISGNLTITGGDIKAEAYDDGVKIHGDLFVSNGNLCAWSIKKQGVDCSGTETIINGTVNSSNCQVGF